jgi:PAS domain-containing protein
VSIPDLELTARLVGLPLPELWSRYVAVGGSSTLHAFGDRIAGEVGWPPREELFLAVALNDALIDESLESLEPFGGFLEASVRASSQQPVGARSAVAEGRPTESVGLPRGGVADRDALVARARDARAAARRVREATAAAAATPRLGRQASPTRSLSDGQRLRLMDARRLDALLQTGAQIVWRTDAAGRMQPDSPTWRAFTGQSAEESVDSGWLDAVHPADRRHAAENWHTCVAREMPVRTHLRLWHAADDDWQLTRVRAVPVHGPDGRTSGWVGTNSVIDTIGRHPAGTLASSSQSTGSPATDGR